MKKLLLVMLIPVLVLGVIGCWDNEVGTEVDQFVQGTWTPVAGSTFIPAVSNIYSLIFTPNQMVLQVRSVADNLDMSTPYIAEFKYGDQIDAKDRWTVAPFGIVNRASLANFIFDSSTNEYEGDFFEEVYDLEELDEFLAFISTASAVDADALEDLFDALLDAFEAIVGIAYAKDLFDAYKNNVDAAIINGDFSTDVNAVDNMYAYIEEMMMSLFNLEIDIAGGLLDFSDLIDFTTYASLQRFIAAEVKLFGFNDSEEVATLSILYADAGPNSNAENTLLSVLDREVTTTDKFYQNPYVFPPFGKYRK
jgi:hypothetical protein